MSQRPGKEIKGICMGCFLFMLLLGACSSPVKAVTSDPVTSGEGSRILVGTDATFPPFESLDAPKRQIIGFDVDLINAIAAEAGLEVEIVGTRYGLLLEEIASCQLDAGISAIPITAELEQQMLFSDPYFTNGQVVVVKKGNLEVTGRNSLAGKLVGAQKGTTSMELVQQIDSARVSLYPTAELAFRDLAEGLTDAVVADKLLALGYVGVKANNLFIAGQEFAAENYGIAVCSHQSDLLKKINTALETLMADGTLNKLEKKWLKAP